MKLTINLHFTKRLTAIILGAIILILLAAGIWFFLTQIHKNPVPADIRSQLHYKAIYPAQIRQIDSASYQYKSESQTLTFSSSRGDRNLVFTEQPAPDSLGPDAQAYFPALGLHPYAQFRAKLGPVALVKFWHSGSLTPAGQSAILASKGTLLIVHSTTELTNAEWKTICDSLQIGK